MKRVRECELDAIDRDGPALVRTGDIVGLCALPFEPAFQLDKRDDRHRTELLGDRDDRAHVVGVAVRDRDHVAALRVLLGLGTLRVVEPRIDVDALASRRVEPE
jgi:hypothetical protein